MYFLFLERGQSGWLVSGCAGAGSFDLWESCWTCQGPQNTCIKYPKYDGAYLNTTGTTGNLTAVVGVPYGGPYVLKYYLGNIVTNLSSPLNNSWKALIEPVSGPAFATVILDALSDASPFGNTARTLPFSVPEGTTSIRLTFNARNVSSCTFRGPDPPPPLPFMA